MACKNVALITGISGQDGRFLTDYLLSKDYKVYGLTRRIPDANLKMSPNSKVSLIEWDYLDFEKLDSLVSSIKPQEFYNLASFSSGASMFDDTISMIDINGKSVVLILEAIKNSSKSTRFCQASSSELFGNCKESPQNENTPFNPRSPYGAAKLMAHNMIKIYRDKYGLFATSAILFNHESPYRDLGFISRKITNGVAKIKLNKASSLELGNLDAIRDWGYAKDYSIGMWKMLQSEKPEDYVLATGIPHTVREMCKVAFEYVGLDYQNFVATSSLDYRPQEQFPLVGDPSKAYKDLGWRSETSFEDTIKLMVDFDLELLKSSESAN